MSLSSGAGGVRILLTGYSELYQPLGRFGLFAGANYRFMGDPDGIDLNDRWLASGGFDAQISARLSIGASYDYREASISSVSDAHELSPWLGIRVGDRFRLEPFGLVGLSSASPDFGLGLRLSFSTTLGPEGRAAPSRRLPSRTEQEN